MNDLMSPDQMSPDELFAPPASRPMPQRLRDEVLNELEFGVQEQDRTPRRWLAPLVAACLAAAVIGGASVLRHQTAQRPADPVTTVSVTNQTEAVAACRAVVQQGGGFPGGASYHAGTDGLGVLAVGQSGHAALCLGSALTEGQIADGADGILTATDSGSGNRVIVVAGKLPNGMTMAQVQGDDAVVTGGYWVWARRLTAAQLAAQPTVLTISYGNPTTGAGQLNYLKGFGTGGTTHKIADATSCSLGQRISWQQPTPDNRYSMVGLANGDIALCGPDGSLMTGPGLSPMMSVSGVSDDGSSVFAVAGGSVPSGVTMVSVVSSLGAAPAYMAHGRWVWSASLPASQLGVFPTHVQVEMTGPSGSVQTVVALSSTRAQVATGLAYWTNDDDLVKSCDAQPGSLHQSIVSSSGHVYVGRTMQQGKRFLEVCVQSDTGGEIRAQDLTTPATASGLGVRQLAHVTPSASRPTIAWAGGALPAGVSSIVYTRPTGPMPATVSNGMFAYEQVLTGPGQTPTSVTLTGSAGTQVIQLR